ncbi:hypothetical protein ACFM35_15935 [Microbacterium sp. P01]|uniref:hypothetical protein n=1 Tax=Microbacterium sp. P01 TaxID=3366261 RepID=UPI00366B540D
MARHRGIVRHDRLPTEDELETVGRRGFGLKLTGFQGETISLGFLAPIITRIPSLIIQSEALVTDVEILEQAEALEVLGLGPGVRGGADLSQLPHLLDFEGALTVAVESVAANPGLRRVNVEGPLASSVTHFAGPIEEFSHLEGRRQTTLPVFACPEKMRRFDRLDVARFDCRELAGMSALESLYVMSCPDVVNLDMLGDIAVESVLFRACRTADGWDRLPLSLPHVALDSPGAPFPPAEWTDRAEQHGWDVRQLRTPSRRAGAKGFPIERSPDEGGWMVSETNFEWLTAVADRVASGPDVEELLNALLAADSVLRALDPRFDSEGDMFVAYLSSERKARRLSQAARRLASDPARIRELLRE